MIKIVIFDDHAHRRAALKLLIDLQEEMVCVGDFPSCINLVNNLKPNPPDVVLMDIYMPGLNGTEGVKLLRKYFPDACIIIQTIFEDDENIFNCILAGAHGYISKRDSPEKLIQGITEVTSGGAPMTPVIASKILNLFRKKFIKDDQELFDLSKREMEILSYLVKGLSHKMIGDKLFISVFTVNNHVKRIYRKLHVHSASEAVATALQKGIVDNF